MITEAVTAAADALAAAGLRVAVRSGDLTPPCAYLQLGGANDGNVTLAGGLESLLWVFWVPVRGVENLPADAEALDAVFAALSPLAASVLTVTRTSLTVSNDTWPAYRADVSLLTAETVEAP